MLDRMSLVMSMLNRTPITIPSNDGGTTFVVDSIEAEDGSGFSFNIEGHRSDNVIVRFYINTKTNKTAQFLSRG